MKMSIIGVNQTIMRKSPQIHEIITFDENVWIHVKVLIREKVTFSRIYIQFLKSSFFYILLI